MPVTEYDARLSAAVLDLAVSSGYDPLELLHDLTEHTVVLLPAATAGVTLLLDDGDITYVTAFDETCRRLEEAQSDLGEGPCLDSIRDRAPVDATEVHAGSEGARRWPRFARLAEREGIAAVAAVPLRSQERILGAVNLFSTATPYPDAHALRVARVLADACTHALLSQHRQYPRDTLAERLYIAVNDRITVEQAKGVLAEYVHTGIDGAFQRMRRYARAQGQSLTAVATRVIEGDIPAVLARPEDSATPASGN